MKFGVIAAFSFVCLVLSAKVALPQEQTMGVNPLPASGAGCERLLRALSADRNGFITREDWVQFMMDGNNAQDPPPQEISGLPGDMTDWVQQRATLFERLDANHDGAIARDEWPANSRSFRHLDTDGNGSLSLEEFMSPGGRFWNELFENWDTNDDDVITRDEWMDTQESFARVDKDRNGVIDRSEFYSRQ